ncbi:hypothetical protein LSH36_10g10035 [Paralvinella palmiformis]|uniref:Globin domain-containing protein n=1 Tax=Paralvinella palmiformis TaxID=53620 RepID=A0AAD9NGP9_9ANNE|nr:hypothetical protein LSH36_10g10035 [Paralvinella palmiformis]
MAVTTVEQRKANYKWILLGQTLELSLDEKLLIRQTWSYKSSDMGKRGLDIFVRLFELHPVYRSYFQKLRDIDIDNLRESPKLRDHGGRVMVSITDLVDTMDSPTNLRDMAIKIGRAHFSRGVRHNQYRELFAIVLDYLQDKASVVYNDAAEAAWQKLFNYVLKVIDTVMEFEHDKTG